MNQIFIILFFNVDHFSCDLFYLIILYYSWQQSGTHYYCIYMRVTCFPPCSHYLLIINSTWSSQVESSSFFLMFFRLRKRSRQLPFLRFHGLWSLFVAAPFITFTQSAIFYDKRRVGGIRTLAAWSAKVQWCIYKAC